MLTPLVSIIIPIYKVEPYLRRCLDSIVNQTYTNLEIILVDDGSPDGCPQICDEYAAKDNRIVVIHKENGGLSDARNAGLDICKGEYISFVDSDDWVDEKYIDILIRLAVETNADIAIGNHQKVYNNKSFFIEKEKEDIQTLSSQEALNILFKRSHLSFILSWGKIYRRFLFDNIRFPQRKFHEDEFTTYKLFFKSKYISHINRALYYYTQRTDSIMAVRHPEDLLQAEEEQFFFLKQNQFTSLVPIQADLLCWQCLNMYAATNQALFFQKAQSYGIYLKIKNQFSHFLGLKFFIKFPHIYLFYKKIKGGVFKCSL